MVRIYLQLDKAKELENQLKELIQQSKVEYENSKDESISIDNRKTYFQQASEKLYKIMIHILEIKSGYDIKLHEDLDDPFYWRQAGFYAPTMEHFLKIMNTLHVYFYEGRIFPSPVVERSYEELMDFVNQTIDKL